MAMGMSGGDRWQARLKEIEDRLKRNPEVHVGFPENSTYPDGTSLPMVAAINEYGANIRMPARTVTVYRNIDMATGEFRRSGRFVKRAKANFATTHHVPAHVVKIPARPFMRTTVQRYGKTWPKAAAALLVKNDYDLTKTLYLIGEGIKGQMAQTITDGPWAPNSPATIRRKGHAAPLIDTGFMRQHIAVEVIEK